MAGTVEGGKRFSSVGQVAVPGDCLLELPSDGEVRVGSGIHLEDGFVFASKAGVVKQTKKGKIWIRGKQKKYMPNIDDLIVGIVKERTMEAFKVDINGPFNGDLPVMAFENVTRRNIPPLKNGDVVYARVVSADRFLSPELSCVNSLGKSGGLGELKGGLVFQVSTKLASDLLSRPPHPGLAVLGGNLKFEIVVGVNGWCWVDATSPATSILIVNTIKACEDLSHAQAEVLASGIVSRAKEDQKNAME